MRGSTCATFSAAPTSSTATAVKVIADKNTHEVLRVHICGLSATVLISGEMLALEMQAFLEDIGLTIHPHPTLGEGLMKASINGLERAIHILNR
jgi:dihydrolipoamide dehydrogenase